MYNTHLPTEIRTLKSPQT